ncbi:MAG: hypothetical protein ROW48_08325 [Bellilinea sp.]|jgi:hypothetical protein
MNLSISEFFQLDLWKKSPNFDKSFQASSSDFTLITAWFGLWFILLITSATQGLYILFVRSARIVPFKERIRLGFAFLFISWLTLLTADLRMISVQPPALFHWLIIFSGISLLGLYLIFTRLHPNEEIFP